MKKVFYLALSAAVALMSMTSCGKDTKDDPTTDPTGLTIKSTLSVEVGKSATLTVAGTSETVSWESADPTIATVVDGKVTGVKAGKTTVVAKLGSLTSNACEVTVTPAGTIDPTLPPTLQGSEYFVFFLDAISEAKIHDRVIEYLGPDEVTKFLYVWDDTFGFNEPSGPNFYDEVEGWTSVYVKNPDWSGAGVALATEAAPYTTLKRITDNPDDYYFHMAIKGGATATNSAFFSLGAQKKTDGSGKNVEATFAIGNDFDDNGTIIRSIAAYPKDNEWHEVEVPFSKIIELNPNFFYAASVGDTGLFSFLAGGGVGKTLEFDAVFIYKK
ncbi:hypothetical protein FACS189434_10470 [Bacteroidia bacterium]|nr:hypothetical protein FACS189434_10470 [Bacteroidia bacterium]